MALTTIRSLSIQGGDLGLCLYPGFDLDLDPELSFAAAGAVAGVGRGDGDWS